MKTEENYTNKIVNNLKDYYKQNQLENLTNPSWEDRMRLLLINSPKKIIKNSWLNNFGDVNKRMSKKLDSLLFGISNKLFFFESFILIKNKGIKYSNKKYYVENNLNKYSYVENGTKRELDYYGKDFFYEIIDYNEFLNYELGYKVISDGVRRFYLFSLGKKSYYFEESKFDIPRFNIIFNELLSILNSQYSEKKNEDYSKSSLLIKTKVKNIITGRDDVIELYDNRLVSVNVLREHDDVVYFDGGREFSLKEFSNMKIESRQEENNKPWIGLSVNRIFDDGSGGQDLLTSFCFINPSDKKKLEKIIFYFENFRKGVEIKDLDKVFLESEKSEKNYIKNVLKEFDNDNNGIIDLIEDKNEFNLLLKKHQKVVIEKGKEFNQNFTHQLIKVGNYINQKRSNLQLIFDCMKQVEDKKELNEFVQILDVEIHSYNLFLINSLNLIVSLIEDDQITFYDIYEKFDKLNIYNSNWENEISDKLSELNKGINKLNQNLRGVMYEIRDMGDRIVSSIDDLSYITEESTKMLDNRLGEIDSSIKTNNLLTLINTYQTYKINKNTKSLRG